MTHRLARHGLQVWSDFEKISGTHLHNIWDPSAVSQAREVNGVDVLELELARTSDAWDHLAKRKVLRVTLEDGTISEYRITKIEEAHGRGRLHGKVFAEGALYALRGPGLCERLENNGMARTRFELLDLTPAEHMSNVIIPAAPSWFSLGTVEDSARVESMVYDNFTPLRALTELLAVSGLEREVERQPDGTHKVHLRLQVGATVQAAQHFDSFTTPGGTQLLDVHVPDDEWTAWVYPGASADWEIQDFAEDAARFTLAMGVPRFTRAESPTGFDDQFEYRMALIRSSQHQAGLEWGFWIWAPGATAAASIKGEGCQIVLKQTSTTKVDLYGTRTDSAGVVQQADLLVDQMDMALSEWWEMKLIIDGRRVDIYRSKTQGAEPTDFLAAFTSELDFRDGLHQNVGMTAEGFRAWFRHPQVNDVSLADPAIFKIGKNATGVSRDSDDRDTETRIYGVGGQEDLGRVSLADARWKVTDRDTVTDYVEFGVGSLNPVWQDDALVNYYIGNPDGTEIQQITDSVELTRRIFIADASLYAIGEELRLFRNSGGDDLNFIEDPIEATNDTNRLVGVVTEDDLPPARNLVLNPDLREYTGGFPNSHSQVGAVVITQNTDFDFWEMGGASAHITAAVAERGIQTAAITIAPTDASPYFSAIAKVWVVSGAVRFELSHSVLGTVPSPDSPERAVTTVIGNWATIEIVPGDSLRFPAGTITLKLVSEGAAAEWYLDAWQLAQTSVNFPIVVQNPGNTLYDRAVQKFINEQVQGTRIAYTMTALDLSDVAFPFDRITLGAVTRVLDDQLGVDTSVRALKIRRDLWRPEDVVLTLDKKRGELTDTQIKRLKRLGLPRREDHSPLLNKFNPFFDELGELFIDYGGNHRTQSIKFKYSTVSQPTRQAVLDSGTVNAGQSDRFATGLNTAADVFVTAVAFDGASGAGNPGPTYEWSGRNNAGTGDSPRLTSIEAVADDTDGDVDVEVNTDDSATQSFRWAANTGASPAWPTDGAVEAGTVRTITGGSPDNFALGAATLAPGETVRIRAAPYLSTDGTPSGTHGTILGDEDTRAPDDPRILTFSRVEKQAGASCGSPWQETLSWTTADITDGTYDIKIYRTLTIDAVPQSETLEQTITTPVATTSWDDDLPSFQVGPADVFLKADYRIELIQQSGPTVRDQATDSTPTQNVSNTCF